MRIIKITILASMLSCVACSTQKATVVTQESVPQSSSRELPTLYSKNSSQQTSQPVSPTQVLPQARTTSVPVTIKTQATETQTKPNVSSPSTTTSTTPSVSSSKTTTVAQPSTTTNKVSSSAKETVTSSSTALYHTVTKGDTLSAIARNYNTSVDALCSLNNISKNGILSLNQRIRVK